jgi:hypothetical protein
MACGSHPLPPTRNEPPLTTRQTLCLPTSQHLKQASNRTKAHYDCLASSTGFQESDQVWPYCPTWIKGKSPTLQPSWDGPYWVVTQINDVVYRIQQHGSLVPWVIKGYDFILEGSTNVPNLLEIKYKFCKK